MTPEHPVPPELGHGRWLVGFDGRFEVSQGELGDSQHLLLLAIGKTGRSGGELAVCRFFARRRPLIALALHPMAIAALAIGVVVGTRRTMPDARS